MLNNILRVIQGVCLGWPSQQKRTGTPEIFRIIFILTLRRQSQTWKNWNHFVTHNQRLFLAEQKPQIHKSNQCSSLKILRILIWNTRLGPILMTVRRRMVSRSGWAWGDTRQAGEREDTSASGGGVLKHTPSQVDVLPEPQPLHQRLLVLLLPLECISL